MKTQAVLLILGLLFMVGCSGHDSDFVPYNLKGMDVWVYDNNNSSEIYGGRVEGNYFKKATGIVSFICEDGELIEKMIEESISTNEARTVKTKSIGTNKEGELVAEFYITWSFKGKSKK